MGWRAGAEFNMMEKSVRVEFSSAGRSFPPYSTGNNHNTWYAASLIDSTGREIPYADRDGNLLENVSQRFQPAPGQKFFLKGGSIEQAKYEFDGPEPLPYSELQKQGYKLPFYADLSALPELERKAIWGMMVGQEGKTNVPVYQNFTKAGFDPKEDVLQCYGVGWTSAEFLPQERQLFGLPGGFMNDWDLMTNLDGLFVAGDALFASNCFGHAAATGSYAGRKAAAYAVKQPAVPIQFDETKCVNCGRCMEVCMIDVMLPGEKHPVAAYPDECWYCGCCVMECPEGAISLHHPLMNQTRWVKKESLLK